MISSLPTISRSLVVGCWQLDDRSWRSHSESDLFRIIDIYLALGITTFDTADIYGRSETLLGRALKQRDCTILTKAVFFDGTPSPNQIRSKIEKSLRNLKRDALDLVQIHWHNPSLDFSSTLDEFKALLDDGKIQRVGVTNFNTPMLEKAIAHLPICSNQVQYSLIDRRVEAAMQPFCQQHNIALLPYGPLAGGFLSKPFLNVKAPPKESDHARSFYYSSMVRAHGGWTPLQAMLQALDKVAQKYQKSIAQIALHWVKQQPAVAAVISGLTLNREQISRNVDAMDMQIAPEDMQLLSKRSAELFEQLGDIYSYERGSISTG